MDSFTQLIGDIAVVDGDEIIFHEDGLQKLGNFCADELAAGRGTQIVGTLIKSARFFDEEKKSFRAAAALFMLAQHLAGIIATTDAEQGHVLLEQANAAAKNFRNFQGDKGASQVLESGMRPAGTTAASPLAKFSLQVPARKNVDDKT